MNISKLMTLFLKKKSKLMTFIFRNKTIFWDISKCNRGQKK